LIPAALGFEITPTSACGKATVLERDLVSGESESGMQKKNDCGRVVTSAGAQPNAQTVT
jgi:hypothetical protein